MNWGNKVFLLEKEKSESDDSILFSFGDNTLELYRSEFPIFLRNGAGKKDLDVAINGFRKCLNKLSIEDDKVTMTFY